LKTQKLQTTNLLASVAHVFNSPQNKNQKPTTTTTTKQKKKKINLPTKTSPTLCCAELKEK